MITDKKKLRKIADKLWFQKLIKPKCECCSKPAVQVHHYFPKGSFGHLRYDLENGISLCQGCHLKIHFTGDPTVNQTIIEKRGKGWYNRLKKKAHEKQKPSYMTVKWYRDHIERLSKD